MNNNFFFFLQPPTVQGLEGPTGKRKHHHFKTIKLLRSYSVLFPISGPAVLIGPSFKKEKKKKKKKADVSPFSFIMPWTSKSF